MTESENLQAMVATRYADSAARHKAAEPEYVRSVEQHTEGRTRALPPQDYPCKEWAPPAIYRALQIDANRVFNKHDTLAYTVLDETTAAGCADRAKAFGFDPTLVSLIRELAEQSL